MPTSIESLQLDITQNGNSAAQGINALTASLSKLKSATKGGMGLASVSNQIRNLNTTLSSLDASTAEKITKLANSLEKLKSIGNIKISSSIASQLKNIGNTAAALVGVDYSGISKMSAALSGLQGITKSAGLTSAITQLNKIPQLAKTLNTINWSKFTSQIKKLSDALTPLANRLNTVSAGFASLPSNISRTVKSVDKVPTTTTKASSKLGLLATKITAAAVAVKVIGKSIASWINQSNKYVEDLNLFTVALGKYANEAKGYADTVAELMGIDPADWLRNQGTFNTIIKGFGVAEERAIVMSKNLTQLGYDISSFYNISVEDAFTKLQSGIAGELEPLRRLGYDLSVARLQEEALALGIKKKVTEMTQAEKSQLRYYAILTQVKDAQGDMARTLNTPANQLRILQAQITQCARALGNIFIPVLNAVLPYLIAVAKVVKNIADGISLLFGFTLPEVDYSGLTEGASAVADAADDTGDGFEGAAKAAKKLKDNLIGIDELNIISPIETDTDDTSISDSFNIDLPEYDFLGGLIESNVDSIVEHIEEFLGKIKEKIEESGLIDAFDRVKEAMSNFMDSDFIKALEWLALYLGDSLLTSSLAILTDTLNLLADVLNGDLERGLDDFKNWIADLTFDPLIILAGLFDKIFGTDVAGWLETVKEAVKGIDMTQLPGYEKLKEAIDHITEAWNKFKDAVKNAWDKLNESGALDIIKDFIVWLFETGFNVLLETIAYALNIIADCLVLVADLLNGDFYSALNDLKDLLTDLTFDPLIMLAEIFDSIFGTDVAGWLEGVKKAIKDFDLSGWLIKFFNEDIPKFWEQVKYAFEHPGETISYIWEAISKPFKEFAWKKFGEDLGKKAGEAVKWFFTEFIPYWANRFKDFWTVDVPKFFTEDFPALAETMWTEYVNFFTVTLPEKLSDIGSWFLSIGEAVWNGIWDGFTTAVAAVVDFVSGFINGFLEGLGITGNSSSSMASDEIGEPFGEGILEGIKKPFKSIKKWVNDNIVKPISNFFKNNSIDGLVVNIKNTVSEWWENIQKWWNDNVGEGISVEAFVTLVKKGWSTVKGWIGSIPTLSQLISLAKSNWNTVKEWIGNLPVISQGIDLIKSGWSTVKGWIGNIPTIDQGVQLIKSGWNTVKEWIGNIPVVSQAVSLIKSGWTTIKNWVGDIPVLSQAITLIKSGWTTVKGWIGSIPTIDQAVSLIKSGWSTVKGWIGNIPTIDQGVQLIKSGWNTVKEWIGNIPTISQLITLAKSGWNTVASWIGNLPVISQAISLIKSGWTTISAFIGNAVSVGVSLIKSGWTTLTGFIGSTVSIGVSLFKSGWTLISSWIGDKVLVGVSLIRSGWTYLSNWIGSAVNVSISLLKSGWTSISSWIGNKVSVGISLFKDGWTSIKNFFGLANGGILGANGGVNIFASGGVISANGLWNAMPKYANGTNRPHGTMFVAGEKGAEMVGHINGTTEVLNRFQMGQIMHTSIVAGMAQYLPIWRSLNNNVLAGVNGIIQSVIVSAESINSQLATEVSYDPSNMLSQSVFEESKNIYKEVPDNTSIEAAMGAFYREYVESTLTEIAADTKRQADKEEQTIVQIGNREINDAVTTQKNANGYAFTK